MDAIYRECVIGSFQNKHSGRKLQWHHHMSNGTITLSNGIGKFDLDVTTFQMAVLFCWENRRHERLTLENLRLATELPDSELRRAGAAPSPASRSRRSGAVSPAAPP